MRDNFCFTWKTQNSKEAREHLPSAPFTKTAAPLIKHPAPLRLSANPVKYHAETITNGKLRACTTALRIHTTKFKKEKKQRTRILLIRIA